MRDRPPAGDPPTVFAESYLNLFVATGFLLASQPTPASWGWWQIVGAAREHFQENPSPSLYIYSWGAALWFVPGKCEGEMFNKIGDQVRHAIGEPFGLRVESFEP